MHNDRVKVALVITELAVGGAERCLVNVACGLDRERFDPTVYSLGPPPSDDQNQLVETLYKAGIPTQFLNVSRTWQAPTAVYRLRKLLNADRPDVVQSFLFHANTISGLGVPHSTETVHCLGIRVADPTRWRMLVERHFARRAAQVVCVSERTAAHFVGNHQDLAQRTTVIPNGVDVDAITKQQPADLGQLGIASDQSVITCVARLDPQKGIDRLLAVAPRMLEQLPHHTLLLVGDGPSAKQLKQMASETSVASRIAFAGWRPDVPQILLASDLMVLPSRWEGMPNVLLEAMACERAVVCAEAEGVAEVLGPMAKHQLATASNPQDLSSKALTIIQQPQLRAQLGLQNRLRVTENFSLRTMIQAYERLFLQVKPRTK